MKVPEYSMSTEPWDPGVVEVGGSAQKTEGMKRVRKGLNRSSVGQACEIVRCK